MLKAISLLLILLFVGVGYSKPPTLTTKQMKGHPPRVTRVCCAFGAHMKFAMIPFAHLNPVIEFSSLGEHKYLGGKEEGNGILYTKRGGFVDLGHVREWADWTAYLYVQIKSWNPSENKSIKLGIEGGNRSLQLNNINKLSEEDKVKLAGKIAFDLSYWHEIVTGYGVSAAPFISEKFSSFSVEDIYSNTLGVELGMQAVKSELEFDVAMTQLLNEHLTNLLVVDSIEKTYAALDQVESVWWSSAYGVPSNKITLKRSYLDEDCIVPWLLPNESLIYDAAELAIPASKIVDLSEFYDLTVKSNRKIPVRKVLPNNSGRKITQNQFNDFANHVKSSFELTAVNAKAKKS